jgi:hypothetical protein
MKSQIRRLAMRAPPMRQPTAVPAIAPVFDCGPGVVVEVAPDVELENVEDVGEAGCEGAEVCEVPSELSGSSDVTEVVVWRGIWIAGIVVSDVSSWKVVVPMIEVMVVVGVRGAVAANRVISVKIGTSSISTVAVTS